MYIIIVPTLFRSHNDPCLVICNLFLFIENLAFRRSTWQQYPWPYPEIDFGSDNAVDGMYTDRGGGGQCAISDNNQTTAMWRVDLGSIVSISHIDIYYRTDNFGSKIP